MQQTQPSLRPRLTLSILLFALVDIVGMVLFATGAMWLAQGKPLFVSGFPTGDLEAGATGAIGLLLMFWAASRILRELLGQRNNEEPGR